MDHTEEIKKRIDIVDFIKAYLQLKKVGINYSALCPFHGEKAPSFMVSPERQSFKCFGCNESGDVISFFMKMEGLEFLEALRILGERVGVQVSFRPKEEVDKERSRRDRIFKINLLAAKYYKAVLHSKAGKQALAYLEGRGLSLETIEKLKLGYASPVNELEKYFKKYGFSYQEIALAGHPERFRYRIIFPIIGVLGQVVGFSGRIFEKELPKGMSAHPKYLNTPETPVFHKSKALYGINIAKDAIRSSKRVVVVEGQMDVAAAFETGLYETVATSGTAVTREHLKVLGRYTPNIIFAFDEDEAGEKAAKAAVELAYEEALEPRLTILSGYKDIGEMVEKNKKALAKAVDGALPPVEWLVERTQRKLAAHKMEATDKKILVREALPMIKRMQDEIERAHYVEYLSAAVGVPRISVEKALEEAKAPASLKSDQKQSAKPDFEADYLTFVINFPGAAEKLGLSRKVKLKNPDYKKIYEAALACYDKSKAKECLLGLLGGLPRGIKEKITSSALVWDQRFAENPQAVEIEFVAIKRRLESDSLELTKKSFASRIAEAESTGDLDKVKELLKELQEKLKSGADG